MAVKRMWVTPSGEIKETLSEEEMTAFRQKVVEMLAPLAYEQVVKDLERNQNSLKGQ